MYTEYVYDNKKYEVAGREIKATLFDIVSTEESKIAELREKAFVNATDPQIAAELQNLYVQQDGCLRDILAISDKLTKALQKVDACSRKLKQIENKNMAQIIATIYDNNNEQVYTQQGQNYVEEQAYVPEETVMSSAVVEQPQMITQPTAEPVMTPIQETTSEPAMVVDEGDAIAGKIDASATTGATEVSMAPSTTPTEEKKEDVIMTFIETDEDEAKAEDAPSTAPAEEKKDEEKKEDVIMTFIETDEDEAKAEDAPSTTPAEEKKEDANAPVLTTVSEESKETVEEAVPSSEPVLTVTEDITSGENKEEGASGPLIPIADDKKEDAKEGEAVVTTDTTSGPLIPVSTMEVPLTINGDGNATSTDTTSTTIETTPAINTSDGDQLIPIDDAVIISGDAPGVTTTAVDSGVIFKKRTTDEAKVIMISGKQATKLRQSLPTQEALLSAKGFFQAPTETTSTEATLTITPSAPTDDSNLEQQLVNNGLLEPASEEKQAQIEEMMNKANELYSQGKVEEAQAMYNQISALNKELQGESAGLIK